MKNLAPLSTRFLANPDVRETLSWARDFGLAGALTGFIAPASFLAFTQGVIWSFTVGAAAMGALSGAVLGVGLRTLLRGRLRHVALWRMLLAAPFVGALWGGLAGGTGAVAFSLSGDRFAHERLLDLVTVGMMFAAPVGAAQLAWLWLAYVYRRFRRLGTWPVVLGSALMSVPLAWTAPALAFGLFGLVGIFR